MGELDRATRWRPELVRDCVAKLLIEGFVERSGKDDLRCTPNGLRKINWPGAREFTVPPPLRSTGASGVNHHRRDELAAIFAPAVAAWALNNPRADWTARYIAQRAYELADALIAEGKRS
jgi:hypothetical protein